MDKVTTLEQRIKFSMCPYLCLLPFSPSFMMCYVLDNLAMNFLVNGFFNQVKGLYIMGDSAIELTPVNKTKFSVVFAYFLSIFVNMAQSEDPIKVILEQLAKRAEQRDSYVPNQGHHQQISNMGNHVPQMKKAPAAVIDSKEAAKLYGGVLFEDFGPRKRPLWA